MIRGNKSFGDAGQHGETIMPPWPSLFAGAFRSALLGEDGDQLARFVAIVSDRALPEENKRERIRETLGDSLFMVLGTPDNPGSFRINGLSLAFLPSPAGGRGAGGEGACTGATPAIPLPADLAAFDDPAVPPLVSLQPAALPQGIFSSGELPRAPLLRIAKQAKPETGRWLDGAGLAAHLAGTLPHHTLKTADLYQRETRLGIALDPDSRTAETGALYTTEAVSICPGTGFLVGIEGEHSLLKEQGLLRLGGDGKAARYRRVTDVSIPAPVLPAPGERFRLILATPGIFTGGWLPDRVGRQADGSYRLTGDGFNARLVCAAVARHDVVSGWDLARWQPKTAQRVVPAGSVYWFEDFQGDAGKLAEWVACGLWGENSPSPQPSGNAPTLRYPQRREGDWKVRHAEGFNLAWLAAWI
jgi:CRISPR-associated protein Cmr3